MAASLSAIFKQLPKIPMPVSKLIRKYPEDALGIICRNVPTVFGPQARTVTYRVLDDMIPADTTKSIDVYFLVFEYIDDDFRKMIRSEDSYKKATLRRLGAHEDVPLDEDVCGSLAFEAPAMIEAKRRAGKLIELVDEEGTFLLDLGDCPDEEFFFFHLHEPLVVTFVS